jgi:hypothetical protein
MADLDFISELVRYPRESLSTEVKAWFAPGTPEGQAPARPNLQLLGTLLSSNPNYTGWPVWLDSRNFGDQTARPYLANEVWEAFIARFGSGSSDHLDFWRLSPAGEFYLYRAFPWSGADDRCRRSTSSFTPQRNHCSRHSTVFSCPERSSRT